MKKSVAFFLLSCLPFTHIASEAACMIPGVFKKPAPHRPAPELPLNVLHYFLQ